MKSFDLANALTDDLNSSGLLSALGLSAAETGKPDSTRFVTLARAQSIIRVSLALAEDALTRARSQSPLILSFDILVASRNDSIEQCYALADLMIAIRNRYTPRSGARFDVPDGDSTKSLSFAQVPEIGDGGEISDPQSSTTLNAFASSVRVFFQLPKE